MQDFKKLIKAGLPTLLVGPAGTAKTSVLRQFASDNKREVVDLRVAMMPPEDLVGIPQVNKAKGCFDYLPPAWAKEHEHNQGADLVIIVEEIHLAPPATHAALYQLLQEKEVAGVNFSKAWVAATANPPEQAGAAVCGELPEALQDRLEVVKFNQACIEGEAVKWLQALAADLGVDKQTQEACGLDGLDLPITPRACERLLRLLSSGVRDESIIARRAGPMTSRIVALLRKDGITNVGAFSSKTGDIIAQAATQARAVKSAVFTGEGFLDDNGVLIND